MTLIIKNNLEREGMKMKLDFATYKDKVMGCWAGKNIGGVLGAPFEGRRQVNDISFYTQDRSSGSTSPPISLTISIRLLSWVRMETSWFLLSIKSLPTWSAYQLARSGRYSL